MKLIPKDGERCTWAERQLLRTFRSLDLQDQRAVSRLAENLTDVSDARRKMEGRAVRRTPTLALIAGGQA